MRMMALAVFSAFVAALSSHVGVCVAEEASEPVVLVAAPNGPLVRDRKTTLLAHFDAADTSDADYARTCPQEVGFQSDPSAPGKFGGGVGVKGANGYVMFSGLDNLPRLRGTAEFWARSRGDAPIWNDSKGHWLFVAYPERAQFQPTQGMAPYHLSLLKSAENELVFRVQQRGIPRYALGALLADAKGPLVRLTVGHLAADAWHHIVISYERNGAGSGGG